MTRTPCDNHDHTPRRPRSSACALLAVVLLAVVLVPWFAPPRAHAQDDADPTPEPAATENWQEQQTTYFTILHIPDDAAVASYYAGFVDVVYEEMTTLFDHHTEPPITLRLYPTQESYARVNPLAPNLPGIVAHADFRHREVAVILPVTGRQSPEGVQNNVRHELTHIIAAEMSDNHLNTGFHEGIAQYVEEGMPDLEAKIQLLSRAYNEGLLLPWSDFDKRGEVYGTPEVSYPQTLSVVAFLIDTYGFDLFREFLAASGESSGYRSALTDTYGVSPAELETAWLAWLPTYIDGGYRHNVLSSYDLSHARKLVEAGHYGEAETELQQAIDWLTSEDRLERQSSEPDETLAEAETLLQRSKEGQEAERLAAAARTALQEGHYQQSRELVEQARAAYAALSDTRQDTVLDTYAQRAERGMAAQDVLARAASLSRALQFPQARAAADEAAAEFALLGDSQRYAEAVALRRSMNTRQNLAGTLLLAVGTMGAVLSLWSRWFLREEEVW